MLLKNGANVQDTNNSGYSPFYLAAKGQTLTLVNILVEEARANVHEVDDNGRNILARSPDLPEDIVSYLVDRGVDPQGTKFDIAVHLDTSLGIESES